MAPLPQVVSDQPPSLIASSPGAQNLVDAVVLFLVMERPCPAPSGPALPSVCAPARPLSRGVWSNLRAEGMQTPAGNTLFAEGLGFSCPWLCLEHPRGCCARAGKGPLGLQVRPLPETAWKILVFACLGILLL